MRYYCPNCWADFWERNPSICPKCRYDIAHHDEKDYVDKLLMALHHRVGDIQHWAIMILAKRKEPRAIPALERLQHETQDPSIRRAAADALAVIRAG
jgi:HEAT repeat protein